MAKVFSAFPSPEEQAPLKAYISSLPQDELKALNLSADQLDLGPATHFRQLAEQPPQVVEPLPDLGSNLFDSTVPFGSQSPAQQARGEAYEHAGEAAVAQGRVALCILAGGMATRLGADVPKGALSLDFGVPEASCLFEIIIRRAVRLSPAIPIIVLVSAANAVFTKDFLAKHAFFGANAERFFFCQQEQYPCVGDDGSLLLDGPGSLASSPNGNGGFLDALARRGERALTKSQSDGEKGLGGSSSLSARPNPHADLLVTMTALGVEYIHVIGVDNPLVRPCCPKMVGFALVRGLDVVNRVCRRKPGEQAGVCGVRRLSAAWQLPIHASPEVAAELGAYLAERAPSVLEYSELPPGGEALFESAYANIAMHLFSIRYLRTLSDLRQRLAVPITPYHLAHKKVPYYCVDPGSENYKQLVPASALKAPNARKFEHFIFDVFHFCEISHFGLFVVDREREFSPIKNREGTDSLVSAKADYLRVFG